MTSYHGSRYTECCYEDGHRKEIRRTSSHGTRSLQRRGGRFNGDGGYRGFAVLVCYSKDSGYFWADFPDPIDVQSHLKGRIEALV